jgi:hypothetical protein
MNRSAPLVCHGAQLASLGTVYAVSAVALGLTLAIPVRQAEAQEKKAVVAPIVFQAAGPTSDSIQSTVDAFRSALGDPNNNNPGPLDNGRREINWDGGGVDTTAPLPPVTPFDVFLNNRGALFTTSGTGLTQAPPSGGPQGGLATLFDNPNYGTIFSTFSAKRLFTAVGSNITKGSFFVPGTNGDRVRRRFHGRRPSGRTEPPKSQHLDRILRRRWRAAVPRLRPRLAGRRESVLPRDHVQRPAHRPGANQERQCRPGTG